MKKFFTAIVALLFTYHQANAQYIPDNAFAQAIANACPTCIDAGHNLTADAQTLTSLSFDYYAGITDLSGLDGFTNLQTFVCRVQNITTFPALPSSLISLTCDIDGLTSLPALPSTLQHLSCRYNSLSTLPSLPSSLRYLNCTGNEFSSLPSLPLSCDTLYCNENPLTALPALPTNMKYLTATNDQLSSLPTLPSTLEWLDCSYNIISSLPTLPNSLWYLTCNSNSLSSLPALPNSLTTIDVSQNTLAALPSLPTAVSYLNCSENNITSLPTLSNSISYLITGFNQLSALPSLPTSLTYLDCSSNSISALPTLPNSLQSLITWANQLNSLPALPPNLQHLECDENYLSSLPALPSTLIELTITQNQFTTLPSLPSGLAAFYCSNNTLVHLPSLPTHLDELGAWNCGLVDVAPLPDHLYQVNFNDNSLTSLPDLPSGLGVLQIENNPIACLPFLPSGIGILNISGTNITCLPNYPPNLYFNLPLCDAGNINGCIAYPTINGNVYGDFNNNGVFDNGDYPASHAVVKTTPGNYVGISDSAGNYKISVPLATTDTTRATDYSVYYTAPLTFYTTTFDTTSGQESLYNNFGMLSVNSGANLDVSMLSPHFVPGFNSNFCLTLKNVGTTSINGTLTITFDPLLVFVSADQGGTSASNTITWNFNGLNPFQTKNFIATVNCPSSVFLWTVLFNDAAGTLSGATDIEMDNNSVSDSTVVTGSYDPNDKEVNDATLTPDELSNGKYLEYTIRFQNTGTAPATFITVIDTLSDKLDATTFEMIAASHHYDVTLANDLTKANHPVFAKWLFNNIQLPDSSVDFANSQGFVEFRIKPKSDLLIGDEIQNTAGIYFDFNAPVVTNSANTVVAIAEGSISVGGHHFTATLFPNPASGTTTIRLDNVSSSNLSVQVLNEIGMVVMQKTVSAVGSSLNVNLDLRKFSSGIYTINVKSAEELQVMKLVKE